MKYIKQLLALFFFLSLYQGLVAQNFADRDYYLVDSIEIDKVSEILTFKPPWVLVESLSFGRVSSKDALNHPF